MALIFASIGSAFSANKQISTDPQSWRIENYAGSSNPIVLWFADPACSNGHIGFDGKATEGDFNRLWITVALAKLTGKKIFVYFNDDGGASACTIVSFGLLEGS